MKTIHGAAAGRIMMPAGANTGDIAPPGSKNLPAGAVVMVMVMAMVMAVAIAMAVAVAVAMAGAAKHWRRQRGTCEYHPRCCRWKNNDASGSEYGRYCSSWKENLASGSEYGRYCSPWKEKLASGSTGGSSREAIRTLPPPPMTDLPRGEKYRRRAFKKLQNLLTL